MQYYFIGIGGIGMSALAHILLDRGMTVSGSDLASSTTIQQLKEKGAQCFLGHSRDHVPADGIVVYGSGISSENEEYQEALRRGLPLLHRAELLSMLMKDNISILVSGSHGKTTVTSLLAWIFQKAGKAPSYAIGGRLPNHMNGYAGEGEYFIAEADESDGSLKQYSPHAIVVTNLEDEHVQNFGGQYDLLKQSIESFARAVPNVSYCWYNKDCAELCHLNGQSYGFSSSSDLHILHYRQQGWRTIFSFTYLGKEYRDIELSLVGMHNVSNAAAAIGIAFSFGIEESSIRSALATFPGVQRRLQRVNESERFLFLEDYAHHPSEVACTLKGVRDAVGLRRVIAIFQPHRFSRFYAHSEGFASAFKEADHVILTDIYSAGEVSDDRVEYEAYAERIAIDSGVTCSYVPYEQLVAHLQSFIRLHDVCLSMGAGNIDALGIALKSFQPAKLSIGILCGGRSCEHDVSLTSAKNVAQYFSPDFYDMHYFRISRNGTWKKVVEITTEEVDEGEAVLSPAIASALSQMDMCFPVLHGTYGEDGTMQGFFDIIDKPYIGPSLSFASIAMNKILTKRVAASVGVPVVPYKQIMHHSWVRCEDSCISGILEAFSFPMFVKSAHLGSSIGVFEIHNEKELREKIREAFLYDTDVFVEESRLGAREIEIACFGDSSSYYYLAEPHERCGSHHGMISYQEKYGIDGEFPATIRFDLDLSEEEKHRVKELADKTYRAMRGKGCGRVDFFLDSEGQFWLSEVNPIPGMTATSPYLQSLLRSGWEKEHIAHQFVIEGLYRFDKQKKFNGSLVSVRA